ncbi:hypothetical protein O1L55_17445 [Streptomyces albulus]|nr:hypothetical protein [Streptomyces noursei]
MGTLMTGLLLGILLARTASGLLAEVGGWRTVYWANAALMLLIALLLRLRLPALRTTAGLRYPRCCARRWRCSRRSRCCAGGPRSAP